MEKLEVRMKLVVEQKLRTGSRTESGTDSRTERIEQIQNYLYSNIDNELLEKYIRKLIDIDYILILLFDKGCIYIKFAQWYISNKLSAFPNVITEFEDVFDPIVPYHSDEYSMLAIKMDLGMNDEELNNYLDISTLTKVASGSIGQVYSCNLKEPEEEFNKVIIKIKHPEVDEQVEEFSKLVSWFTYFQSKQFFRKKFSLYFDFKFMIIFIIKLILILKLIMVKSLKNYMKTLQVFIFQRY